MNSKIFPFQIIFIVIFFYSCANQLPPSGGQDDTIPPKITFIFPKPNTTNYKDNKIILKFDEYIDRRSFEEAFYISPKPEGEIKFDWSGKEVEITFSKQLERNKTYVITIGNDMKDLRGSNKIETPVTFAFSTGDKIDKGKISGKIYADNYERVKILSYILNGKSAEQSNPKNAAPDFITQVSDDGSYSFTNLPEGNYRIFAIIDDDRNNLFDKDFDKIAILSNDYSLSNDSNEIKNLNFLIKDFEVNKNSKEFLNLLKPDAINFIYSNISDGEKNIPPDYKVYFYFKDNDLSKADIVNNFSLVDSAKNKSYRLVFNWLNDSLLEIFSIEKFLLASELKFKIDLTSAKRKYDYEIGFETAERNSFGKVSGKIISNTDLNAPVYIKLFNKDNKFISYSKEILDDAEFIFDNVFQGSYILFSFIDEDGNGRFDKGNYFPFTVSEKFILYEKELNVKGGWNVENVFLEY